MYLRIYDVYTSMGLYIFVEMDTYLHRDMYILISPHRYSYVRIKVRSAGLTRLTRGVCAHARIAVHSTVPQPRCTASYVRFGIRGVGRLQRVARVLDDERT